MATTIAASFSKLASNLEITSLQSSAASIRQQAVRSAMEAGFTVLDTFLTGSYAKSTMIAPLADADIDIFVVLDASHFAGCTSANLLKRTRDVLRARYPKTPRISADGQAVTITFTDFKVDAVPAFHRKGGGYIIPNAPAGWISTDPTVHLAQMILDNDRHDGRLVPLVKMLKGWNRIQESSLRGFYLELMTAHVLSDTTFWDYPSSARLVFDKARHAVRYAMADPAGLGDEVQGIRSGTVAEAVNLFEVAYNSALRAEYLALQGRISDAVTVWRQLFGDYFPAYG